MPRFAPRSASAMVSSAFRGAEEERRGRNMDPACSADELTGPKDAWEFDHGQQKMAENTIGRSGNAAVYIPLFAVNLSDE